MRKLLIGLVSAGILFTFASPVLSQDANVTVRSGDRPGVNVRIGDSDRRASRVYVRDGGRRHWRSERAECRTVIIKKRMSDGTRVTRRIQKC